MYVPTFQMLSTLANQTVESTPIVNVDLTITISVILAVCALISPICTSLINNRHQQKMKLLELREEARKEDLFYHRNIYENYLKNAMKCLHEPDTQSLHDYAESYALALIYFPHEYKDSLILINDSIVKRNGIDALSDLNKLSEFVRKSLSK